MLKQLKGQWKSEMEKAARELEVGEFTGFSISVNADFEVLVTGCREILRYTEQEVILLCDKTQLSVAGENLKLLSFSKTETRVGGIVTEITRKGNNAL